MTSKRAPRRPRTLDTVDGQIIAEIFHLDNSADGYPDEWYAEVYHDAYGTKSARKLSAWLIRAADYCDHMNAKGKK
jgi:hypothetical protein